MNQNRGRFFAITISVLILGALITAFLSLKLASRPDGREAAVQNSSEPAATSGSNAFSSVRAISNLTVSAAAAGTRPAVGAREFDLAINPYAAGLREPGRAKRAWESDFPQRQQNVSEGAPIRFELTGGVMASGVVKLVQRDGGGNHRHRDPRDHEWKCDLI